jgi:integrase
MHGYVIRKRDRYYAVIYEGLDPVTGRERRSWHPAGTDRSDAERLAQRLAAECNGRNDEVRSLTFGAYLTRQWLPGKKLTLATSTYRGYVHKTERHVLPALGTTRLRGLRPHHLESSTTGCCTPATVVARWRPSRCTRCTSSSAAPWATPYAWSDHPQRRPRGPRTGLRSIPKVEQQAWTAEQLRTFLRAAAGHRLFPALWLSAMTGMRRSELLGLRWTEIDFDKATVSINRGLVAIGYELHESRGKTDNSRRSIDLDPTTLTVLRGWRALQAAEYDAVGINDPGWVFAHAEGRPIHPHALSQTFERIARRAGVPVIRLHDLRHTHGTLLIKDLIPVKVVSERLGHANIAFTIETYQHVLPGMQRDAAHAFEALVTPSVPPAARSGRSSRLNVRENTARTR